MLYRVARSRHLARSAQQIAWLFGLAFLLVPLPAGVAGAQPVDPDTATDAILLDRIGYGPDAWSRQRIVEREYRLMYLVDQVVPERLDDGEFEALLSGFSSLEMDLPELITTFCSGCPAGDSRQPLRELAAAKILRAIASRRQLEAVLTDLWANWFSVDARGGIARWAAIPFERDAIRPHVFGRFEDMLIAVAQSPAMLDYLDNRYNRVNSLNENYAREVLELHTIGVDAFTQGDVIEVARAMTGWTIVSNDFAYRDEWHDQQPKRILDELDLPANGGIQDGITLLQFLATHPLTAGRVCHRLVEAFMSETRFVPRLERACVLRYLATGGDLRSVVFQILGGLRFTRWDPNGRVKQPLHLVASVYRALGRTPAADELEDLRRSLRVMGHAPFEAGPPTGYPQNSAYWSGEGGLLNRFNWVRERLETLDPDFGIADGTPEEILDALAPQLVMGGISETTRSEILAYLAGIESEPGDTRVRDAAFLLLSSPEFSRY